MIGIDFKAISQFAVEKVNNHLPLFQAIMHPTLRSQHAMLLLRASTLPRINFLCRTLATPLVSDACEKFDEQVRHAAITILRLDQDHLSHEAICQMLLPMRLGGLGLCRTLDISPAAFLGSIAGSSPMLVNVQRPDGPAHSPSLLHHIHNSFTRLRLPSAKLPLPSPELFPPSQSP